MWLSQPCVTYQAQTANRSLAFVNEDEIAPAVSFLFVNGNHPSVDLQLYQLRRDIGV